MKEGTKLKDIAKALGVSIATVSRALNNKADISISTKKKVLEKARELNYPLSRQSITFYEERSSQVIGVVIPIVNHYFFSTVLKGIMAKAYLYNYLVLVGESLHDVQYEKQILEEYMDFGVNGILLTPCIDSNFQQNLLPIIHRRIPTVVVDRMYDNYIGNYVLNDDFNGACLATQHLIDQGYQRIAHIGSLDHRSVGSERRRGYRLTLEKHNMNVPKEYVIQVDLKNTDISIANGYEAARKLFSLPTPPDAIFAVTDDAAMGVYKYAKDHHLKIPEDLGIVGFSNSIFSQLATPSLTTVEQNGYAMGELAFDYFLQALQSNGQVYQKTFKSKLIVRESSIKIKQL